MLVVKLIEFTFSALQFGAGIQSLFAFSAWRMSPIYCFSFLFSSVLLSYSIMASAVTICFVLISVAHTKRHGLSPGVGYTSKSSFHDGDPSYTVIKISWQTHRCFSQSGAMKKSFYIKFLEYKIDVISGTSKS